MHTGDLPVAERWWEVSETPRTDAKEAVRHHAYDRDEYIVPSEFARQLERELAAMTAERDAALAMLRLKELCDMPADYAEAVKRLEAERDAIKNLADIIARDYAEVVRDLNEAKATLADYKIQLCPPDNCKRESDYKRTCITCRIHNAFLKTGNNTETEDKRCNECLDSSPYNRSRWLKIKEEVKP